jgi:predicted RNA-binding Zn-ribbon protein involved in translation (DUF1610 family)
MGSKVNLQDYIGQQIGNVVILRENKTIKQTRVDYKCNCGRYGNIRFSEILAKQKIGKNYRCRQCGIESTKKGSRLINGQYFYQLSHNAKSRGLEFLITPQDLENIWITQNGICNISGLKLELPIKKKAYKEDGTPTIHYFGNASVDRINSYKGYTKDNVQWIHSKINIMKMEIPQDDFIQLCKLIVKHNEKVRDIIIDDCVIDKFKSTNQPNRKAKFIKIKHLNDGKSL